MRTTISSDKLTSTTVRYVREFRWRDDPHAGFSFDCDESGKPTNANPEAQANYAACLSGEYNVVDLGMSRRVCVDNLCPCGSGEWPENVYDARGIYVCRCCAKCRKEQLRGYRSDIFTDPQYHTDECIDGD